MANFSSTYPSTRPVFNADFSNAGRLDSRITFSRSDTPPTYAAPSAVHYWSNEKHLSSYNAFTKSEGISNWVLSNVTPTADAVVAPDGTTTGDTIAGNSGTIKKYVQSNTVYDENPVISVYAKAGTHNYIQILTNYSSGHYANFDITSGAGVVGDVGGSTTATIQAVGSTGWYRCIARFSGGGPSYVAQILLVDGTTSARASTTTTTGNVHLWGAMANNQGDLTNIVAYQPSTTQIHREYAPTLKSVSYAGQPRFEYSPTDSASAAMGESRGLLIESASTNLVSYSESFSNQTINNSTLTEGAAVGPDGTLNANLLVPTSTGATGRSVNLDDGDDISHTSGNNYAFSIYAKSAGYNYLQWVGLAYFGSTYCNFDLSNGTVGNKSGSVTGSVESVGNGWYRLTVVAPATTTNNTASKGQWQIVESLTSGRATGFTGNDYSGVLLTMAQCELSSFSSSYIKSDSGSVSGTTRAADSASLVSSSLFDNGGASIVMETENTGRAYYAAVLEDDSTGLYQDYVALTVRADSKARQTVTAPGSTVASDEFSAASTVGGSYFKIASRFAPNDFGVCIDGGTVTTDTTGAVPSNVDKLFIGWYDDGGRANAHIKRVAIYPPLTDTNLQALTS
jgi:hypothetical protein